MNVSSKKNVFFLSIDTLTFKRLGVGGNPPSPSPVIDDLISRGHSFTNCFAAGCPTQISFPAIMSSTYPLDDEGYGRGIKHRKKILGGSI